MTSGVDPYAEQVRGFSEAKGGGFFFFSADRKYLIKTLSKAEHKTLLKVLARRVRGVALMASDDL